MRKHLSTIILIVLFLVGLSVMLYPTFSNWWNQNMASHSISTYKETVASFDNSKEKELLEQAHAYNEALYKLNAPLTNFDQLSDYDSILNISGTGIMGYVSIPSIRVELPIYHGTSEGVLQVAAGHIQGSSLPVGGTNTHCVISGHRGLPSARLFTDLDQIVEGDIFTINVLNEVLTYEVEKILIIKPEDSRELEIIPGGDYVTLMTCTPYGVNSHRLLIRAHRIATMQDRTVRVSADAVQIDQMKVLPFVAVPLVVMLMIYWSISGRIRRRKKMKINPKYKL
ncbi:MAG: Sortase family protein [Firmicutes bacterium ADurb.BinA205]|nr:MAG: Sortase family protein [Firmicutes bacterium ADurb.BinA205]